jgi:hypothetical protein
MWYANAAAGTTLYAESKNGVEWTKYTGGAVLAAPFTRTFVMKSGAYYYAFAESHVYWGGDGNIYRFVSSDGIAWTYEGLVLSVGSSGTWDTTEVAGPYVWIESGTWWLTYWGRNNIVWQGGLASSSTGLNFTKHASNPVFGPKAMAATVQKFGSTYYAWGSYPDGTNAVADPRPIAKMTSQDLVTWTKTPGFVVPIGISEGQYLMSSSLNNPCLLEVAGRTYMFYTMNPDMLTSAFVIKMAYIDMTLDQIKDLREN